MRIILTIAGLGERFGGPSRSVPALASALGNLGADVELITTEPNASDGPTVLPPAGLVRTHLVPRGAGRTTGFARGNPFARILKERCAGPADAVIHDQGLWLASNHAVAVAAGAVGRPRVVSPRGMLSTWALAAKGLKKKAAWSLYQRRDLMRASGLHVTADSEVVDCRRLGYQGPIAIVPNGTELPPPAVNENARSEKKLTTRTALCFGRVHPVKGLATLIEAWAQVRPAGWRLVLAGRDDNGHAADLRRRIADHNLQNDVEILEPAEGASKWTLYRSADLFVLPSHSENFGLVVAEALASAVPVLTTRGTPWSDLRDHRCGWWIDTGIEPLRDALRTAVATSPAELRAMGERGKVLVESKYKWESAAREMLTFYETVVREHKDGRR